MGVGVVSDSSNPRHSGRTGGSNTQDSGRPQGGAGDEAEDGHLAVERVGSGEGRRAQAVGQRGRFLGLRLLTMGAERLVG